MTKTAHTPGPWSVSVKGRYVGITHVPTRNNPLGGLVCKMHSGRPEIHADARLIAAAPGLLDALEAAVEWNGYDDYGIRSVWLKQALSAIAKAKGGAE